MVGRVALAGTAAVVLVDAFAEKLPVLLLQLLLAFLFKK